MKDPVTVTDCTHPRYTHLVIYPGADGKRLKRYFNSETDALEFAKEQRKETGQTGTDFGSLAESERAAVAFWREFVKTAEKNGGAKPPDLLAELRRVKTEWLASKASVTVTEGVEKFLAHQDANGASKRHRASLKSRLERFARDHAEQKVSQITAGAFQDWLNGLRATRADKEGEKLTPVTRHNLTRSLRSFFGYALEREWTLSNPIPAAKRSKTRSVKMAIHKAPAILLPADVARFMQAVKREAPDMVAFWALKFFAGVRDAEAARVGWDMIDIEEGRVHLPAAITKTGEQRVVKIETNLAAWLRVVKNRKGPIVPRESTRKRRFKAILASLATKAAAGEIAKAFDFPSNAARHCFGTFHLFHFRDAGETALQLGHKSNPAMLHEHYKNPSAEKHAGDFWEIFPTGKPKRKKPGNVVELEAPPVRRKAR